MLLIGWSGLEELGAALIPSAIVALVASNFGREERFRADGLGMGSLASQLGSVTVSSVPDEQSGEVGGLQNTITNLGISVGTALTGAIVIAALSSSFLTGVEKNSRRPRAGQVPGRHRAVRWDPLPLRRGTGNRARSGPCLSTHPVD